MTGSARSTYRFGAFELDPGERRLLADGEPLTLAPKVFDTLVLLVSRAGHVVSKDELMHTLWPRGFVEESNLTKHIWLIRKALADEAGRWIETVPKVGYRFSADVTLGVPVKPADPASPSIRGAGSLASTPGVGSAPEKSAPPHDPDVGKPDAGLPLAVSTSAGPLSLRPSGLADPGADTDGTIPVPMATATDARDAMANRGSRWRAVLGAGIALVVIGLAAAWFERAAKPPVLPPGVSGTAVAVVGFDNLTGNARDAWLGPALGEMLATEIAAGGHLHVLPGELVAPATRDLPPSHAGGYAVQSIALLRRRLGTDYVLSGSYLVSGQPGAEVVRLDLALQDAHDGGMLAALARTAPVTDLSALVAQAGADLRVRIGVAAPDPATLRAIAEAQPPSAEVARHMGLALDALRRSDPAQARDELLAAVAQAPGYAPAYSQLARAWSALGYGAKALAAAEQAKSHAQNLPEEQRLLIDTQLARSGHEHAKAIAALQAVVTLRPQNPDYRLDLIAAQLAAGRSQDATSTLTGLLELPGEADDPRAELASSDIAAARSDSRGAADHARKALALAEARNEDGQIARARVALADALDRQGLGGTDSEAERLLREAVAAWQRIGNPHGEAVARRELGVILGNGNRGDDARSELQTAMGIFQRIGDLGGMAATYTTLSRMLWFTGDRDGAAAAAQKVLDLGRQTDDPIKQVWGLQALATVAADDSASDEVVDDYKQAIALTKTHDGTDNVWAEAALADVLRMRGDFAEADKHCQTAKPIAEKLSDRQFAINIDFTCAALALDRGEIPAAIAGLERVRSLAQGDTINLANVDMTLAQIDMGHQRWGDAVDRLTRASDQYRTAEGWTGMADAQALLALCAQARGDAAARDSAEARARELRRGINSRQEVFAVDVALAELRAAHGEAKAALVDLDALAADAGQRRWIGWVLECQLAAVRVAESARLVDAASRRAQLDERARRLGFGWVLARLHQELPAKAG